MYYTLYKYYIFLKIDVNGSPFFLDPVTFVAVRLCGEQSHLPLYSRLSFDAKTDLKWSGRRAVERICSIGCGRGASSTAKGVPNTVSNR